MPVSRRTLLGSATALAGAGLLAAGARAGCNTVSALGGTAEGKRLARIAASPNFRNGSFQNLTPVHDPIDRENRAGKMLQFLLENSSKQRPDLPVPSIKTDLSTLADGQMVWLGHSGFVLRTDSLTIVVDPALHACSPIGNFFAPFPGSDIYRPQDIPRVDVLVITHDHYDHLDMLTVREIEPRTERVVCPLGVGAHLEHWGWPAEKITELDWTEHTGLGGCGRITCLPSQHFSGRTFKRNQTLWCGFMLEVDGFHLYLSGDGGYGQHFAQIASMWPRIDLAIVENGQYNVDWAGIHLLPQDWKRAVAQLRCPAVMGCHNSKFDLSRHTWIDPMVTSARSAAELHVMHVTPKIGERVLLDRLSDFTLPWWPESV